MDGVVNSLEFFSKASFQLVTTLQAGTECKPTCCSKHAAGISLNPTAEPQGQEDPLPALYMSLNRAQTWLLGEQVLTILSLQWSNLKMFCSLYEEEE